MSSWFTFCQQASCYGGLLLDRNSGFMQSILFICTGNYYRSRFSESYFNARVQEARLPFQADSAGLRANHPGNVGPISIFARKRLERHDIQADLQRFPRSITQNDFSTSAQIIALDESEHRPMMEQQWPSYADKITYWHIPDIQFMEPEEALDRMTEVLERFLDQLGCPAAGSTYAGRP